jgi:hypothetical protein
MVLRRGIRKILTLYLYPTCHMARNVPNGVVSTIEPFSLFHGALPPNLEAGGETTTIQRYCQALACWHRKASATGRRASRAAQNSCRQLITADDQNAGQTQRSRKTRSKKNINESYLWCVFAHEHLAARRDALDAGELIGTHGLKWPTLRGDGHVIPQDSNSCS